MLDILEWALDVMGFSYTRLDGRYLFGHSALLSESGRFFPNFSPLIFNLRVSWIWVD